MGKKKSGGRGARYPAIGTIPIATVDPTPFGNVLPVDSWRSYRDDITNLQALSIDGIPAGLNAAAPVFIPSSTSRFSSAPFTPYQPLRTTSYQRQTTPAESVRAYSTTHSIVDSTRLPGAGGDAVNAASERVLPSIESDGGHQILSQPGPRFRRVRSHPPNTLTGRRSLSQRIQTPTPPPLAPSPTEIYLKQAKLKPVPLSEPQKLLVILDLNGTLLFRKNRAKSPTSFQLRPGVTTLLRYLFENHIVMVYTSARFENAAVIINKLMHPDQRKLLAAIWARDKLDLTPAQYASKVQVYKKLEKIWDDEQIQKTAGEGRSWSQSNTILVDDSHSKALAQPHNLLQVPEFIDDRPTEGMEALNTWSKQHQDILKQLELKLEELKRTRDVSCLIRLWQSHEATPPIVAGQSNAVDEAVDQKSLYSDRDRLGKSDQNSQLPIPNVSSTKLEDITEGKDLSNAEVGIHTPTNLHDRPSEPGSQRFIDPPRSISPIDEAVWQEILGTGCEEKI